MEAGFFCWCWSSAIITNTILWGNEAPIHPQIHSEVYSSPSVNYCDVEGGYPGQGNIDEDPLFVLGPLGSFYLSQPPCQPELSPCVDAGSPLMPIHIHGTTCTDGRPDTGIVDMGYHYPLGPEVWGFVVEPGVELGEIAQ